MARYDEGVTASSSQGLDRPYTVKEPVHVQFKRWTLVWALGVLTVLIFVPVVVPALGSYCFGVVVQMFLVIAGILGIEYKYASTAAIPENPSDS